jgi:hypothetical protein
MVKNYKKTQGEIFGIALLFVILIIGFIVYAQFKKLNPNNNIDVKKEKKYEILAQSVLQTLISEDTGCIVERNKQSVKDLINFCLENSYFSEQDPIIHCTNGKSYRSCARAIQIINYTLYSLFNGTNSTFGNIPFFLTIELPADKTNVLNKNITNFNDIVLNYRIENSKSLVQNTYYKLGYKRVPSGLYTWATSKKNINFNLYLFYR